MSTQPTSELAASKQHSQCDTKRDAGQTERGGDGLTFAVLTLSPTLPYIVF